MVEQRSTYFTKNTPPPKLVLRKFSKPIEVFWCSVLFSDNKGCWLSALVSISMCNFENFCFAMNCVYRCSGVIFFLKTVLQVRPEDMSFFSLQTAAVYHRLCVSVS